MHLIWWALVFVAYVTVASVVEEGMAQPRRMIIFIPFS